MFTKMPRGGGGRGSPGARSGDGPTPLPRNEKLQLRSLEQKRNDTPTGSSVHDVEATRSLLNLSSQGTGNVGVAQSLENCREPGAVTPNPPVGNHGPIPSAATNGQNGKPQLDPGSPDSWFGQALEYAAGFALRTNVLQPVLEKREKGEVTYEMLASVPSLLGSYSIGKVVLLKGIDSENVEQASIQRITHQDAAVLRSWWEHDKVLSYTSPEWSDWWVRRCHSLDPGCEMLKLVKTDGTILGLVYYERNIVDRHLLENGESTRSTLIRGIRLAPSINPEVIRRSKLCDDDESPAVEYKGIASLLFCHVLFMSIRYGSQCVGLYSPKSEVAERFYESFMGKPVSRHEGDGRRYYRVTSRSRWNTLRRAFDRQLSLSLKQDSTTGSPPSLQQQEANDETKATVEDDDSVRQEDHKDVHETGMVVTGDAKRRKVEEALTTEAGDEETEKEAEGSEGSDTKK